MELYDVKARGLRSPLNSREISILFRAGRIGTTTGCRPVGEGRWLTVDELFPLLRYESGRLYEMKGEKRRGSRPVGVVGAIVAILLGVLAISRSRHSTPQEIPRADTFAALPVAASFTPAPASDSSSTKEVVPVGGSHPIRTARSGTTVNSLR